MSFIDSFATPDDLGPIHASDLHEGMAGALGATIAETLDPQSGVSASQLWRRLNSSLAGNPNFMPALAGAAGAPPPQSADDIPDVPIADAKARVKQEGLDGQLPLPEQSSIKQPVLDLMISEAHEHRERQTAIARGPQGFFPSALEFATSIGAGMIDPVNMAAFSVPVLGEARWGKMLASAGDSVINRAGVRALQGAAQGAAGTALLQPAEWWFHTQDGRDYTMAEALRSVALGAGMGAAFHAGIGAVGDVRARMQGQPLPGSTEETLTRALQPQTETALEGRTAPRDASEQAQDVAGTNNEAAPGLAEPAATPDALPPLPGSTLAPGHPAHVLADLPETARADVARAAAADMIAGRPVRVAEMLNEAAKQDPRIAETIDAWHGSPHDFDAFDVSKIGTGEGAQSFGHGLYFAEHPEVARSYIPLLPKGDPGGLTSAGIRLGESRGGSLYRVNIKASREKFFDWDKPINEQSAFVQDALRRAVGDERFEKFRYADAKDAIARDLLASSPEMLAKKLREVGVPGITYLDQRSRAFGPRGNGNADYLKSSNYVVFSDKHVEITHKNGKPVSRAESKAIKDQKRAGPQSLLQFIAAQGGISSKDPLLNDFLQAVGGKKSFKGAGKLVSPDGVPLDRMREAAVEAGYLHDPGRDNGGVSDSTVRDLIDAVDTEARGQKVYARGEEPVPTQKQQLDAYYESRGERGRQLQESDAEIGRLLDEHGLAGEQRDDAARRAYRLIVTDETRDPRAAVDRALDELDIQGNRPGVGESDLADWEQFANARPEYEDPQAVAESHEAARAPEPASIAPERAVSAAEKAAADARELLADMKPRLSEEEWNSLEEALSNIDSEKGVGEQIVRDGAACLAAAVAA